MFKKKGEKKEYSPFFTKHTLWMASATLMGTVIGAGILGIPYVVAQSGLLLGIINLIIVGTALLILHLCLGEITLRTKKIHQLAGYIEKYLGKKGKYFMICSMVVGIYGALIAYLIGEGDIFRTIFGGNPAVYTIIFFAIVSMILYQGIKATGRTEMLVIVIMILIVLLIGIFSIKNINTAHFTGFHWTKIAYPYGVILFAFVGTAAIPELREELQKKKKEMKKAILVGSITPIIIYLLFTIIALGIIGPANFNSLQPDERIATIALRIYAGNYLSIAANIFAALAMFTSFLGLGLALKEMYEYDLKLKKTTAFLLTIIPPLIIALSGMAQFIEIIGFTGAVAGGIDGILILSAYWKAKKYGDRKPEYSISIGRTITFILIVMFLLGIIYQLWQTAF